MIKITTFNILFNYCGLGLILLLFDSAFVIGQEKAVSNNDWRDGYTLILMDNTDSMAIYKTREFIINNGGTIAIVSPPHVMLGWIDPAIESKLTGKMGITSIHHDIFNPATSGFKDDYNLTLIRFFNYVVSGQAKIDEDRGENSRLSAMPMNNCVKEHPVVDQKEVEENLKKFGMKPLSSGTSDYMTGTVAVCLFFIESDGSVDPNQYTWTLADQDATIFRAIDGLSWWALQAPDFGENVSFTVVHYASTSTVCQQGYEPITRPSDDDYLWIEAIMENLGFTSGNYLERVTAFDQWLLTNQGTNRSFSVFVGYNPAGAPSMFTDDYFAYAYIGGPFVQMLYRNDGYGIDNFGMVLTHETGHIFWACDEYYSAGYSECSCDICAEAPERAIANANCEHCNPNAVSCMMRDNIYDLCSYTPLQVGWQLHTWVDFNYTGSQNGTFAHPYKTFLAGANGVPSGDWLWLKTGQSQEPANFPLTITIPMTIKAWNGPAIIGN